MIRVIRVEPACSKPWLMDELLQDMVMQRSSSQEITKAAVDAGRMKTLKEDAMNKILGGITTMEEAASAVMI